MGASYTFGLMWKIRGINIIMSKSENPKELSLVSIVNAEEKRKKKQIKAILLALIKKVGTYYLF